MLSHSEGLQPGVSEFTMKQEEDSGSRGRSASDYGNSMLMVRVHSPSFFTGSTTFQSIS